MIIITAVDDHDKEIRYSGSERHVRISLPKPLIKEAISLPQYVQLIKPASGKPVRGF